MSLCVVLIIVTGVSVCCSQNVGGLTDSELDIVVDFVKSHEIFQPISSTNSVGRRVVGYSFEMDDGREIFDGLFSGIPDFERVRDGLESITEQQATQLLKEELKNIVQALDAEFGSFASYSFDRKKSLTDAEFANILSDEIRTYLVAAPRWQRVCFAIITSTEGDDTRRFDDCRSICPVPTPYIRNNATYDACTEQLMFPYGVDFNDEIVPVIDDGSSGRIDLLTFFPFYDELHESLFVNTNGIISFDEEEETFSSQPFPLTSDQVSNVSSITVDTSLIAPFWADVDTTKGGTIYYRQMTRRDDESLADAVDDIVNEYVMYTGKKFQLIWYLVATWDQVAYYGSNQSTSHITNTFQAILVMDGIQSYTIFNYGDIQWTTGTASGGDSLGLGGTPAQVGCNAGDEFRHHNVPESQTNAIVDIDETSNVGQPGRYIFKISEENVVSYDCKTFDSGSILTYPSFGSMLGGARIFIQGPFFDNQDIVTCKFIDAETGPEVPCQYENERTVSCVVPWLLRIGRVPVFLLKDGGMTFGFQIIYTAVSVDEVTEDVAPKARLEYDDDLQRYTVMWRADALPGNFFDIDIILYDEYNPTNLEIVNMVNDMQLETAEDNYEYLVPVNFKVDTSKLVGVVRVMQGDEEPGGNNDFALYIWSDPFDVSIFYKYDLNLLAWCISWSNLDGEEFSSSGELRCPCNLQSALVDRERFEPSPRCSNTVQDSCSDDDDIVHCVRSSSPSSNGEGLECCYDLNGDLANIADNLHAGYIHRYHYLGREPFDQTSTAPYFSHYTSDVLPYIRCCSTRSDCDQYFIPYRPSQDCNGYQPPRPDSGSILAYPSFGSMLGGARIFIQGPFFDNQDIVTCKFIDAETGPEVPCQYENERAVSCVVPWLLRIGRVPVFLSKDGGMTFGFQLIYTAVSVDEVTEDVAPKARLEYDDDLERYTVMWRADALPGNFFDIDIILYDEYNPTNLEIVNMVNDMQLETAEDNYEYLVPVNFKVDTSKLVGVIRVMQGDREPGGNNNDFALYIWSDPFDVSIFYKYDLNLLAWCISWSNLDGEEFSSSGELRCPCNLQSALVDRGRFEPSPRCSNTVQESCSDDDDIVHCVRSSSPSSNGEGLECCYYFNGDLANIADNLHAGYNHRYHYLGREPFDQTGTAPYFSHYTNDVLPYIRCCSTRSDCDEYFIPYRPSQDCNGYQPPRPDSGSILTYPSFGSMLGGGRIFIQGTCFDNQDTVTCKFIDAETGPEVPCQYEDERTVSCVVPWLLRIGRVQVFLSKDGGMTYGYRGIYTAVSVDEVTEDIVSKARLEYDDDLKRYTVIWRADALQGHFFDIDIVLYDDYDPTNLEMVNIANDRQFETAEENYEYLVPVNFEVDTSKLVGVVRVMQGNEPNGDDEPSGNNDFALYIWSDPFDVSIFYEDKLNLIKWCSSWSNLDGRAFSSDGELRCPCNLQTALVDRGRFEPSPRCSNTIQDSCSDDNGIVHCVRSSSSSSNGEGLECCYYMNGELANIADNLYAGYIHRYHYLGTEPFDRTGTAPYFSHYTSDVLPYIRCCSTRSDCDQYFIPYRPSQDCTGYQPPRPARMNGDPHILTLDGLAYTFNGHGEYVLMDALGGLFVMQGRTEPIQSGLGTTTINATRFTAIAAKFNNVTMVHVALNQVRGLVAYMTEDYVWSRISFDDNPIWSGPGITIFYTKATNETSVSITVAYDFGLSFVVEANNDLMSIIVYGPEMLRGNTSGLLGNWNDDVTDDLRTPDGDIIPSNSSLQDIHYDFGEKWRVDSEDSILYYITGTDYSTYYNPNFVPWFEEPDNIDQEEVKRVCGDNFECIFDYQVTGNVEIAKVTKDIVEFVEEIKEDVKPVVVCGFISTPQNGSKTGTTYTEGSILIFNCDTGFKLTGESRIICTPEGIWSDLTPVCVDQCEYIEAPQNGAKQFKGQTIQFTCEDGYKLNGESSIMCMGGMVSDSVPTCEEEFPILYVIIGGVAGLIILIGILCTCCFCCRRSRRRSQAAKHKETAFVNNGERGDTRSVNNPTYDGISNSAYETGLF